MSRLLQILVGAAAIVVIIAAAFYFWVEYEGYRGSNRVATGDGLVIDGSDKNLSVDDARVLLIDVRRDFFDPDSARFAGLNYTVKNGQPDRARICGHVNGKNRLGGYIGYQPFFYEVAEHSVVMLPSELRDSDEAAQAFLALVEALGCPRP
ncbi:MAG: hypothetical protein WDM94_09440 [Bauldia sp.]